MQQQRGAVGTEQQKLLDMMNQQQGPLSQTGMSDLDKASLMFQAAGALGQTTRSGGFGETLGNLGTSLAGPLSKAAEAQRQRQGQLQQLQLARQKLSVEMAGQQGVPAADMLSLIKSQRERVAAETEEPESKLITLPSGDQVSGTYKGGKYYDISGREITPDYVPQAGTATTIDKSITGDAFLSALKDKDPALAGQVQQMINGEAPPPTGRLAQTDEGKRIVAAIMQADPTGYGNVLNATRMKVEKDFSPGGKLGQTMGFAGKALDHLAQFQDLTGKLNNVTAPIGTQTINAARNAYDKSSGQSNYTNAETQREMVMTEVAKFLKQGTPAAQEIRRLLDAVPLNGSPEQMQGAIDQVRQVIIGQVDPLVDQYKSAAGPKAQDIEDGRDYLRKKIPVASRALAHLEDAPIAGSKRYEDMQRMKDAQQAQGQPAPTSAPTAAPVAQAPAATSTAATKEAALRAAMAEMARRNAQAGAQ
jgi:hypothetical protein